MLGGVDRYIIGCDTRGTAYICSLMSMPRGGIVCECVKGGLEGGLVDVLEGAFFYIWRLYILFMDVKV